MTHGNNAFTLLGNLLVWLGVAGEAGTKIYLRYHPNCAAKVAVAKTLGIQNDQVFIYNLLVLLHDYGVYIAAAGLLLVVLGRLPR